MPRARFVVPFVGVWVVAVLVLGAHLIAGARPRPLAPPLFGPNVRANQDATTFGQHEPSLAVSRVHTNTVILAAKDYRDGDVKHVWIDGSTDGGATWPVQLQMPGLPPDVELQSDPVVMARDDGRIYVACLAFSARSGANGVFLTWTDDDGRTWQTPSAPVYYPDAALDDKDWFALDNSPASPYYHRMYMMYAPNAGYVVEQHSADGGLTWSARQPVGLDGTEYPYPLVGRDGTVYAFMMDNWGAGQTGTILLNKSADGGVHWGTPRPVATAEQPFSPIRGADQFRFFAIPSAAVDPNTNALYVAWTDNRNFTTDGTDVVYVKSADGGTTWTPAPIRLSHDPAGVVRDHITPVLSVGMDSRLHAFWLDRRLDPQNHLFDSWYSSSSDGGQTWDADTRVSTVSQDLNAGLPPGSGGAAGDYWGLDTARDTVYVAWNDTRRGNQDIFVAKGLLPAAGGAPTPTPGPPSPTPCAIRFADVQPGDYFYTPVGFLACRGVLSGYADGRFRPYNATTRGQMVKIVVLAFGLPAYTPPTPTFRDVPASQPFYTYVESAAHARVVDGYADGTFHPAAGVTRGQLAKIVVRAAGWAPVTPAAPPFTDVPPASPFYTAIATAACHGIAGGYADGTFRPFAGATRGQIAKIVYLAGTDGSACAPPPPFGRR